MIRAVLVSTALQVTLLIGGNAFAAERLPLRDEPSRDELARYAMTKDLVRAIPRKFEFPKHVVDGQTFGIDVSHYQGKVNWTKIVGHGVSFAYAKATEGTRFYDSQFSNNWAGLMASRKTKQPILRGAYHFMSAVDDSAEQAQSFLAIVGLMDDKDLPPCLDVEWDFERKKGKFVKDGQGNNIDRWSSLSPTEIVSRLKIWLKHVESVTGKRPIIYTNTAWWKERIGDNLDLAEYELWIADYTSRSLKREVPVVPKSFKWAIWQITDLGTIASAGLKKGLDTNLLAPDNAVISTLLR
jgi:lysozyme